MSAILTSIQVSRRSTQTAMQAGTVLSRHSLAHTSKQWPWLGAAPNSLFSSSSWTCTDSLVKNTAQQPPYRAVQAIGSTGLCETCWLYLAQVKVIKLLLLCVLCYYCFCAPLRSRSCATPTPAPRPMLKRRGCTAKTGALHSQAGWTCIWQLQAAPTCLLAAAVLRQEAALCLAAHSGGLPFIYPTSHGAAVVPGKVQHVQSCCEPCLAMAVSSSGQPPTLLCTLLIHQSSCCHSFILNAIYSVLCVCWALKCLQAGVQPACA